MSEIPSSVTVEVPAELVVEAAARLLEVDEWEVGDHVVYADAGGRLLEAANGQDGDAFWTDPLTVEAYARAYERLADLVERRDWRARAKDVRKHKHAAWEAYQPIAR